MRPEKAEKDPRQVSMEWPCHGEADGDLMRVGEGPKRVEEHIVAKEGQKKDIGAVEQPKKVRKGLRRPWLS